MTHIHLIMRLRLAKFVATERRRINPGRALACHGVETRQAVAGVAFRIRGNRRSGTGGDLGTGVSLLPRQAPKVDRDYCMRIQKFITRSCLCGPAYHSRNDRKDLVTPGLAWPLQAGGRYRRRLDVTKPML